jgi:hypothetical protein
VVEDSDAEEELAWRPNESGMGFGSVEPLRSSQGVRVPILTFLGYAEIALCLAVLGFLVIGRQWKSYWALGSFLAVRAGSSICLFYLHSAGWRSMGTASAYKAYFEIYWLSFAIETLLAFLILYGLFRMMVGPLEGLRKVGTLVFRWTAVISLLLVAGTFARNQHGPMALVVAVSQLQRIQGLLALVLAAFLCFAGRSLGLSLRSRVVAVSGGLALMGANDFVQAAWLTRKLGGGEGYAAVNGAVICFILLVWAAYFALPEPQRGKVAAVGPLLRLNFRCLRWYE